MYLVDYRAILAEKYVRQKSIKELKTHANGHCVHIGEISPGCRSCLTGEGCKHSVFIGKKCLFKCPMCYYKRSSNESEEDIEKQIKDLQILYFSLKQEKNYKPTNITFNSEGEPFSYLQYYSSVYKIIKEIEQERNIKIHKRIYTSGTKLNSSNIDILKELEVEEIRFHISASNFSEKVYDNIKKLKELNFRITVEEPSWPLHKEKLLKALPILNDVGIKHLNMDEIDITPENILQVNRLYPMGRMYKNLNYHLYDEGLVYDIMEETIKKGYSFSVLDCNSDLYKHRTTEDNLLNFDFNSIKNMCSNFDFGERNGNI